MTTPTDPTTPPTDEAPGSEDDHKYQPGADGLCSCQRDTPPTDEALRALVEEGLEAFRLTREYVGEDTLPNVAGWSHFDWSTKARAVLAAARPAPVLDVEALARFDHFMQHRGQPWETCNTKGAHDFNAAAYQTALAARTEDR